MFSLRLKQHHPSKDELLLYVDGELSFKKAMKFRSHLEHCWSCRAHAAELQEAIAAFVHFLDNDYTRQIPQPRRGWRGFAQKLQLRTSMRRPGPAWFSLFSFGPGIWRFLTISAVAITTVLVIFAVLKRPPAVSAAELLHRAIDSQSEPLPARHTEHQVLQIRFGNEIFRKEIIRGQVVRTAKEEKSSNPEEAKLAQILEKNHFRWQDPLSATSFAIWRDSLSRKKDQVARHGDRLSLTTRPTNKPADNELIQASLTVRTGDFHPIGEILLVKETPAPLFLELTELDNEILPEEPAVAVASAPAPSAKPAILKHLAPELPPPPVVSAALELQVLSQLHTIGADLGQEAVVARTLNDSLTVTSIVDTTKRKEAILNALAPFQGNPALHIRVQTTDEVFQQETTVRPPPQRIVITKNDSAANSIAAAPALLAYLARLGIPETQRNTELQKFSEQAVKDSSTALLHALAMRDLMNRFQADQTQVPVQGELKKLIGDHTREVREATAALRAELWPVFAFRSGAAGNEPIFPEQEPDASPSAEIQKLAALIEKNDEIVCAALTLSDQTGRASEISSLDFWHSLDEVEYLSQKIEIENQPLERGKNNE